MILSISAPPPPPYVYPLYSLNEKKNENVNNFIVQTNAQFYYKSTTCNLITFCFSMGNRCYWQGVSESTSGYLGGSRHVCTIQSELGIQEFLQGLPLSLHQHNH